MQTNAVVGALSALTTRVNPQVGSGLMMVRAFAIGLWSFTVVLYYLLGSVTGGIISASVIVVRHVHVCRGWGGGIWSDVWSLRGLGP